MLTHMRIGFVAMAVLLLVFLAASNSVYGGESGFGRVGQDTLSDQTGQRGEINGGCRILDYYCDVYYYCPIPSDEDGDYFNMRFTVETPCTLKTVQMAFYSDYPEFSDISGMGIDIVIWDDDGSGLPGTVIYTANVPSAEMVYYPEWVTVDVESAGLVIDGDFHVGYTTVDQVNDNYAVLADDGSCGDLRSSHYYMGMWETILDHMGADINFYMAAEVCGPAQFTAYFSTPGRESHPFDVTISDGENVQSFYEADSVSAIVPSVFTLALEYEVDSHFVMADWELQLNPGEAHEFEFYAVDPNEVSGRTTPYLLGQEVGTMVDLTWDYSAIDTALTYTVETTPLGRHAFVTVWSQTSSDNDMDEQWVQTSSEVNGESIVVWWCDNGHDAVYDENNYVHTRHNSHKIWIDPDYKGRQTETVTYGYSRVSSDDIAIGIRKATDNHVRVPGYDVILHTGGGQYIDPEFFYPQWVLPVGETYSLEVQSHSDDYAPMIYPFVAPESTNAMVFDPHLPRTSDLEPYTFHVTGQNVFASCSHHGFEHAPGDSISVIVSTNHPCDWWGSFILPEDATATDVVAYTNDRGVIHLTYLDYWIEYSASGNNIVTVRIEPSFVRLNLTYEESPCTPGDADGNGSWDIDDVVYIVSYVFLGGPDPTPCAVESGDASCDCQVDIDDVVRLIDYIFTGGPPPCTSQEWSSTCGGMRGSSCDGSRGRDESTTEPSSKQVVGTADLNITRVDSGQRGETAVSINSDLEVQAIQLEFKLIGNVSDLQSESLIDGAQIYAGIVDGVYRVGLLDVHGQALIPSGGTELMNITYGGTGEIRLINSIAVAENGGQLDVTVGRQSSSASLPKEFRLNQNFPNPFNPTTEICFSLPSATDVTLDIYNISGRKVATLVDGYLQAGEHSVTWNGRFSDGMQVASGVYFYRIETDQFSDSKKMLLLK